VIDYPHERKCIDRWLGVAEECTDEMAFTIIAGKAKVVVRKSLWAISDDKMAQPSITEKLAKFDESVQLAYGQEWIYRLILTKVIFSTRPKTEQSNQLLPKTTAWSYITTHMKRWTNISSRNSSSPEGVSLQKHAS
jgi:hypothetical protein